MLSPRGGLCEETTLLKSPLYIDSDILYRDAQLILLCTKYYAIILMHYVRTFTVVEYHWHHLYLAMPKYSGQLRCLFL